MNKRKLVKENLFWNVMVDGLLEIKQIQILQHPLEKFWNSKLSTFSKQSLNVELCKISKREEKEDVYPCNTNIKI